MLPDIELFDIVPFDIVLFCIELFDIELFGIEFFDIVLFDIELFDIALPDSGCPLAQAIPAMVNATIVAITNFFIIFLLRLRLIPKGELRGNV